MDQELQSLRETIRMDISYLVDALKPLGIRNLRQDSRSSQAIRHAYAALASLRQADDYLYALTQYGENGNTPHQDCIWCGKSTTYVDRQSNAPFCGPEHAGSYFGAHD